MPQTQFQWTNELPWKLWLAFAAAGFSALVTGFLLGRWDREMDQQAEQSASANAPAKAASSQAKAGTNLQADAFAELGRVAAKGKAEYSEGQGSAIKPDMHAWIYAFPIPNESAVKIPKQWFLPKMSHIVPALQALGGNATQADDTGAFELRLLRPGTYLILICSAQKSKKSKTAPPKILPQYFQDPAGFLKNREFQWQELDYKGRPTDSRSVPFVIAASLPVAEAVAFVPVRAKSHLPPMRQSRKRTQAWMSVDGLVG